MIKISALNRILKNKLEQLFQEKFKAAGFKYKKSKKQFSLAGNHIEISISTDFRADALNINSNQKIEFHFHFLTHLDFSKIKRWYKKQFGQDFRNKYALFYHKIHCKFIVAFNEISEADIYIMGEAAEFKLNNHLDLIGDLDRVKALNLEEAVKKIFIEIIPKFNQLDNLKAILELKKLSKANRTDILIYFNELDKAEKGYQEQYLEIKEKISQENDEYKKAELQNNLKLINDRYTKTFKKNFDIPFDLVSVKKGCDKHQPIKIGKHEYQHLLGVSEITPSICDFQITKDRIYINHYLGTNSCWNFEFKRLEENQEKEIIDNKDHLLREILDVLPKDYHEDDIEISKNGKFLFLKKHGVKSYLFDIENKKHHSLWMHETFRKNYKDKYKNVPNNFGANIAQFIFNDNFLVVGACHAKNVVWKIPTLERIELQQESEFTFENLSPKDFFKNDILSIKEFIKAKSFITEVNNSVLIWNEDFQQVGRLDNIIQLKKSQDEEYLLILNSNKELNLYQKNKNNIS